MYKNTETFEWGMVSEGIMCSLYSYMCECVSVCECAFAGEQVTKGEFKKDKTRWQKYLNTLKNLGFIL